MIPDDLVTGLEKNDLLDVYSHLLTGYIGNDLFLRKVADTVRKLRAVNPKLVYGKFKEYFFYILKIKQY